MKASWLPQEYPGKTTYCSLSLFALDAEIGKAEFLSAFPFQGILPECIAFDKTGTSIVVATFDHHGTGQGQGSLDFWKFVSEKNKPELIPFRSYPLPRGVHYFTLE